jgi:hypothetical protein
MSFLHDETAMIKKTLSKMQIDLFMAVVLLIKNNAFCCAIKTKKYSLVAFPATITAYQSPSLHTEASVGMSLNQSLVALSSSGTHR